MEHPGLVVLEPPSQPWSMASSRRLRHSSVLGRLLLASVVWLTTLALLLVLAPRGAASRPDAAPEGVARPSGEAVAGWAWPLSPLPRVVRSFDPPESEYGPGHRGVDLEAGSGQAVQAVASGTVTHSGSVGGRGTVTVLHDSGVSSTYEPLEDRIGEGSAVASGDLLGTIGSSDHCAVGVCLHLGARLGGEYLDPLLLLTRARIILLPLVPPGD